MPTRQDSEPGYRFPVSSGQVWAAAEHLVSCSDLVADDLYPQLLQDVDLFYSDPPWTPHHLRRFRSDAGHEGEPDHTWTDIYQRIVELADGRPLYLESGVGGASEVRELLPGPIICSWEVTYAGGPFVLHYSGSELPPLDPSGMHSFGVCGAVLRSHGSGSVADPCCGLGGVPLEAAKAGWRSVSNELHPRRVSVTLDRLAQRGCPVSELEGRRWMPTVSEDYELSGDQAEWPLVWEEMLDGMLPAVDTSDAMLEQAFGPGAARKLKSWGHSGPIGVHWLVTRSGTSLHTDPAYARYTHHLILRNDGFRLRGLEDRPDTPILRPGAYYCLDAFSPHQVVEDKRISALRLGKPLYKMQVAFDTDTVCPPSEAIEILLAKLADDPNAGAAEAAKSAPAPRSGARA